MHAACAATLYARKAGLEPGSFPLCVQHWASACHAAGARSVLATGGRGLEAPFCACHPFACLHVTPCACLWLPGTDCWEGGAWAAFLQTPRPGQVWVTTVSPCATAFCRTHSVTRRSSGHVGPLGLKDGQTFQAVGAWDCGHCVGSVLGLGKPLRPHSPGQVMGRERQVTAPGAEQVPG